MQCSCASEAWIDLGDDVPSRGSRTRLGSPRVSRPSQLPAAVQSVDIFRSKVGGRVTEGERDRTHEPYALLRSGAIVSWLVAILEEPEAAPLAAGRPVELSRVVLRDLVGWTAELVRMHQPAAHLRHRAKIGIARLCRNMRVQP